MLEKLQEVLSEEQMQELVNYVETEKANATQGLFSEEDFNKQLQSETDKVRTKYSKQVKELEEQISKLKPVEKSEAELELEKRLAELEGKQKEVEKKERYLQVQSALTENNLPTKLADYLAGDDVETVVKEVSDILNQHLLNSSYKPSNHKNTDGITKDQFKSMSYAERMKLFESNQELFNKLSN